jgi:hypothetical protein
MRHWCVALITMLAVTILAGCGVQSIIPTSAETGSDETYTSAVLDTSYPDALDVSNQLALGTLQLEETEQAVTPEQAATLLPLWQALQGGVTVQAEVDAVLKQIEGTMAAEQLEAIVAMQLTQEDLQAWMQEQGPGAGGGFRGMGGGEGESPELRATRQAEFGFGDGEMPPEMATRRAEFEGMSEEEREALRATAQAGGGMPGGPGGGMPGGPGGGGGAGGMRLIAPLNLLIDLLEARAGEG